MTPESGAPGLAARSRPMPQHPALTARLAGQGVCTQRVRNGICQVSGARSGQPCRRPAARQAVQRKQGNAREVGVSRCAQRREGQAVAQ